MTIPLAVGVSTSRDIIVDEGRIVTFVEGTVRVYATPEIIWDMERVCRDLFNDHLPAGEDSLGVKVDIVHVAAGLPGTTIRVTATVAAFDGRRVMFNVTASDGLEVVAHGQHERVMVSLTRVAERLAFKQKRLGL